MNKEEIKVMIKDCIYSDDGITYMSDKQYNNYTNTIEKLQQENKQLKERIDKAIKYIDDYMYDDYGYIGYEDELKEILSEVK